MIGQARNLDGPSTFASSLDGAAGRFKGFAGRLLDAMQARFGHRRPTPLPSFVGTPVIPTVRYRDVGAAIEWLCRAFGMRVHRVVTDASGAPCYAELTIGSGMLMVAPIEDTPFGRLMVQPDEIGGVETQVCYLCVGNARAHYARAKAAGAAIVLDIEDEANQGRGYSCRDPEGHVWNFGTYDPWEAPQQPSGSHGGTWGCRRLQHGLAAVVLLVLAGALVGRALPQPSARAGVAVAAVTPDAQASVGLAPAALSERPYAAGGPEAKGPALPEAAPPNAALEAAERTAEQARKELAEARSALERAEREVAAARSQLDELQRAKEAAERAAAEARGHLAAAQKTAERARLQAALERTKRLAAIRAAMRARRAAPAHSANPQTRTWCYNPSVPFPAASRRARLAGFCRS